MIKWIEPIYIIKCFDLYKFKCISWENIRVSVDFAYKRINIWNKMVMMMIWYTKWLFMEAIFYYYLEIILKTCYLIILNISALLLLFHMCYVYMMFTCIILCIYVCVISVRSIHIYYITSLRLKKTHCLYVYIYQSTKKVVHLLLFSLTTLLCVE